MLQFITPDWPAPSHIKAFTTTRLNGFSQMPFASFNLGDHVGDDSNTVRKNRQLLKNELALPNEPLWLQQVHGANVMDASEYYQNIQADACYTRLQKNTSVIPAEGALNSWSPVCVIMTADCLPILITDTAGSVVAAIHAGWRSLAAGIIEKTIERLQVTNHLMAWLGPAISAKHYEVGPEVKSIFTAHDPAAETAFTCSSHPQKSLMDIYMLARLRLQTLGITNIYGGDYCTYKDAELFYSYRRDGQTGRMATLIWIS